MTWTGTGTASPTTKRELDDLDEEYRQKRAEIERALAHLREEVAREYPDG